MTITLIKNGVKKKVAVGFSWKSFFFGCMYPAARSDYKGFFIHLGLAFITFGASAFVIPFTYNKRYVKRLVEGGWQPEGILSEDWLIQNIDYSITIK